MFQPITMSGDIFSREREFCLHFIKNNKTDGVSFDFNISNSSVDLIVKYSNLHNWDSEKGVTILITYGRRAICHSLVINRIAMF